MNKESKSIKKWIKTAFLFASLITGNAHSIEFCIPADPNWECDEYLEDAELIVELEPGLGAGHGLKLPPSEDEIRMGIFGRFGLGSFPLKLTSGVDVRMIHGQPFVNNKFIPENGTTEESYGAYIKFSGFPVLELSSHYLIKALRKVEDQSVDAAVFNGYGMGLGIGLNLFFFTLRTDATYYQFQEKVSNGETVQFNKADSQSSEDGVKVNIILSFPIRANIDFD
ncbi:MAG: hypothetical protein OXB84_09185 [Halobacteriovoraceae bacterium]|nr:hypothetical protein [Halobacteriovoraceae bacterium]